MIRHMQMRGSELAFTTIKNSLAMERQKIPYEVKKSGKKIISNF